VRDNRDGPQKRLDRGSNDERILIRRKGKVDPVLERLQTRSKNDCKRSGSWQGQLLQVSVIEDCDNGLSVHKPVTISIPDPQGEFA
jgi:hypothetical protein